MIKKVLLTIHTTFSRFIKSFTFFSLMNLSIPQTFDELFKNLLTTGVSSCTSSCSESHFFKLLLDLVIRSSSCSTTSSNKLVISFKLSVNSYFSFPSLHSAIVALSRFVFCNKHQYNNKYQYKKYQYITYYGHHLIDKAIQVQAIHASVLKIFLTISGNDGDYSIGQIT